MSFPWLTALMLLPLVGAAAVSLLAPARPGGDPARADRLPKLVAMGVALATLVYSGYLALTFVPSGGMQFTEDVMWIRVFGAHYSLGLDGIGLSLVLLTTILTPVVMLASWNDAVGGRWGSKGLFGWMLALEGLSIGVFTATDVFLFYILFEATLIPIYFMVAGYGGPTRVKAAMKFLVYSLVGGLVMLASVIGLYVESAKTEAGPTYLISELAKLDISTATGRWLFLGFFLAFAIKAPMFPVHTWLPDTTEAATPGTSVLLVSVLDKIGTFGMIRFCLQIFPEASVWATPVVIALAVVSILYGAVMAIAATNIPRLIAYTSVSHFGFIVLGIFVMNSQGLSGANLYMFNHGLSTAALFLVTGFLISRRGSGLIADYGGVEKVAPVLAGVFLVAGLSTLSLPGLSPFVSEMLVLIGAFVQSPWVAAAAVPGIVLAAVYVLWLYQRTMTGPIRPELAGMRDLTGREIGVLAPLVLLIVLLGFYPRPLFAVLNPSVETTMSHVQKQDPAPTVPGEAAK